jgi:hypothetical protein
MSEPKYTTNHIFSKNDFDSNDGMMTSIWGPSMWHILHTVSFNYPTQPTKKDKINYMNFYKNLVHILPCKYCRINFVKNLKKVPLTMDSMKNRGTLSKWAYDIHEEVNNMLKKKSNLSYEDVRERYETFRSRCLTSPSNKKNKKTNNKTNGNKTNGKKTKKKEKGCTKSLYGVKSKCVLNIVPKDTNCESFEISPKCKLKSV